MVDSDVVSRMFRDFIERGIVESQVGINVVDYRKGLEQIEINDYIDQFIYYRKLRGYSLDQAGHAIGVSGKYYWKYEKRIHRLTNIDRIMKIADFLKIEEDLKNLPR